MKIHAQKYFLLEPKIVIDSSKLDESQICQLPDFFGISSDLMITPVLEKLLGKEDLSGYKTKKSNCKFLEGRYLMFVPTGKAQKDDFGINKKGNLVVSEKAKQLLESMEEAPIQFIPVHGNSEFVRHEYDVEIGEISENLKQRLGKDHELLKSVQSLTENSPEISEEYKRRDETNLPQFVLSNSLYIFDYFLSLKLLLIKPYRIPFVLNYQLERCKEDDKLSFIKRIEFSVLSQMEVISEKYPELSENSEEPVKWLTEQASRHDRYYTDYISEERKENILKGILTIFAKTNYKGLRMLEATKSDVALILAAIKKNISGDIYLERMSAPGKKIKWNLSLKDVAYIFYILQTTEHNGEKPWANLRVEYLTEKLFIAKKNQSFEPVTVSNYISKFKQFDPDIPKNAEQFNEIISKELAQL